MPTKIEQTSWSFPDLPGTVIASRSGRASSRWNRGGRYYRRTHPFPFHSANRRLVHALHRRFVEEVISGNYKKKGAQREERPTTLFAAIDEFKASRADVDSPNSKNHFERAFAYYTDTDMRISFEGIYRHLMRRHEEPPEGKKLLQTNTRRAYLQRIRRLCEWMVRRGLLDKSPMDLIPIPARTSSRKSIADLFTSEEVASLVEWHREQARTARNSRIAFQRTQHAIITDLAYTIGARPSELLRGRWEDVSETSWTIWGKAAPQKGEDFMRKKGSHRLPRLTRDPLARKREIPIRRAAEFTKHEHIAWQEKLTELLDEARMYEEENEGWLFCFKHTQVVGRGFTDAMEGVGIEANGRTFRRLRHSSRRMMEEELRRDPITIADLLGHSPEMGLSAYRGAPDADTLAARFKE